jgi:hypothetical protein
LATGPTLTLPVVEGGFLGSLPRGAKIEQIAAYDESGNAVATWTRTG